MNLLEMKKNGIVICVLSSILLASCEGNMSEDEIANIGVEQCMRPASFIKSKGFDLYRTAFSTSDPKIKGLVLIELPKNPKDTVSKKFIDPSWTKFGPMGSITTDENGNAYTANISVINTLDVPLSKMNRIYKVDQATGELKLFKILPAADTSNGVVQYAVLGLYYDCHGHKLYVSSVAGSTRENEQGVIYEIDPLSGEILDQFKGYDAMGVFVGGTTGKKLLYFGSARNSDIYAVELTKSGKFKGKAKVELSLDQLGPRGDDKARRIRYDKYGNLNIYGIEFNFSLVAPSLRQENFYQFNYNSEDKKWINVK